ncbi:deoxyribodipyrimidine photo-lyase [Shimia sp. R10_1]|uniref:cryptochrome/photolyase family protein n=1 Tax=Shimia sp. R10_1 TaxID=2821095 RepID=UPI001AD95681|nr:deoxyribodipyrimidine photo-lyase [Shimia sp. R10_1]MBO9472227.1 deoxyribodipyrimidine photo-lyase [Shimia sp. R10_1]
MAQNHTQDTATIHWFRRDLRLSDNRALTAAAERGPVVPVFVLDDEVRGLGAASKQRLEMSLEALAADLETRGMQLILRRGRATDVLLQLAQEVGAKSVHWSRAYAPDWVARDTEVKAALKQAGLSAESFEGTLLFEPWTVQTGQGMPYRVYTPFWKAVRSRVVDAPLRAPDLKAPSVWPQSETLSAWGLSKDMRRGAAVVAAHVQAGEAAAQAKLSTFLEEKVAAYQVARDFLDRAATSDLSDALTFGEVSPAQLWHGGHRAMQQGAVGAEHFLKEVVWREFAWHLLWHFPQLPHANWRDGWDQFEWSEDPDHPHFQAWCRGRTGVAVVDAAMRELYITGKMHNRARMIVASYLTKHLRMHWKLGLKWFAECLIDWDPASNAMGWQWVAGCGPDAAPYFRIFNPDTQADKFDPEKTYRRRWFSHKDGEGSATAQTFFQAMPVSWEASFTRPQMQPIVSLPEGRARALAAYEAFKTQ